MRTTSRRRTPRASPTVAVRTTTSPTSSCASPAARTTSPTTSATGWASRRRGSPRTSRSSRRRTMAATAATAIPARPLESRLPREPVRLPSPSRAGSRRSDSLPEVAPAFIGATTMTRSMIRCIAWRCSTTIAVSAFVVLFGCAMPAGALAAPFRPASDSEVLERLPWTPDDAAAHLARARRMELERNPRNLGLALEAARGDVMRARADGDPRYLGYAQAALGPWWNAAEPPAAVQVLRATIRQSQHDFDAALDDLRQVLERDPANVQAWLTQALIQQTRGDYAEARRSCTRLLAAGRRSAAVQLTAMTCTSSVASFAGDAPRSYVTLNQALRAAPAVAPDERVWALGV